jgi:benzoate 4-monooxygenase
MELKKTVATLFKRFDYRRVYENGDAEIREGFHYKVQELLVLISRRT